MRIPPMNRTPVLLIASLTLGAWLPVPGAWGAPPATRGAAPAEDIASPPRGAKAAPAAPAKPGTQAPAGQPAAAVDRLLWDYWYTVTVNKVIHYEYYNDRVELKKGRLSFQNRAWKMEEDYLNEEQVGAFALNDPEVTPLFFNFHSTYRSTETTIDASVKDGKELMVRVRKGKNELPVIKRSLPSRVFFSQFFPVWLGRHLASFKPMQVHSFQSILEDNLEANFAVISGQVRMDPPDETAQRTQTTRLTVNYQDMKSIWWVDAQGAPVRIEMPLQKTVVDRVPRDKAQAFLDDK